MSAGWVRAEPLFQRAIAMDPDFAMGHAQVRFDYSVMGESALTWPSALRAYRLRDQASDVERFYMKHCTAAISPATWKQYFVAFLQRTDESACDDLFTLSKDAGPKIPVVNEALTEYTGSAVSGAASMPRSCTDPCV